MSRGRGRGAALLIVGIGGIGLGALGLGVLYATGVLETFARWDESGEAATLSVAASPEPSAEAPVDLDPHMETSTPLPAAVSATPSPPPQTVGWTRAEVDMAVRAASSRGTIPILNTWSADGMLAVDAITLKVNRPIVILDFVEPLELNESRVYHSSFEGLVTAVYGGDLAASMELEVNGRSVRVSYDRDSTVLVRRGQSIAFGTPLVRLEFRLATGPIGITKRGYLAFVADEPLTLENIIHDEAGRQAVLVP